MKSFPKWFEQIYFNKSINNIIKIIKKRKRAEGPLSFKRKTNRFYSTIRFLLITVKPFPSCKLYIPALIFAGNWKLCVAEPPVWFIELVNTFCPWPLKTFIE